MRVTLVAATCAALFFASAAEAKLCVAIDAPRYARAGTVVTVRVTTLQPTTWEGDRPVGLEPAPTTIRLRLRVERDATSSEVALRRTKNPTVWRARVRLDRRGVWTMSVVGWEYAPRRCAPPVRIRVR